MRGSRADCTSITLNLFAHNDLVIRLWDWHMSEQPACFIPSLAKYVDVRLGIFVGREERGESGFHLWGQKVLAANVAHALVVLDA